VHVSCLNKSDAVLEDSRGLIVSRFGVGGVLNGRLLALCWTEGYSQLQEP